jgi:hypothetical protein
MSSRSHAYCFSVFVLVLAAPGCDAAYPEGVYPCATAPDCPPAWFCHADHLCWSAPETDAGPNDAGPHDAGRMEDVFVPDAAQPDVGAPDTSVPDAGVDANLCVPTTESCNGVDDDCDLYVDEGVMQFSDPTTLVASPTANTPRIVSAGSTIGVVYSDSDQDWWQQVLADGMPSGAASPLGLDTLDLRRADSAFNGATVLLGGTTSTATVVLGFDPSSGSRTLASYSLAATSPRMPFGPVRLAALSRTRASVFEVERDGTTRVLRRYRLNTAGASATVVAGADAARDLSGAGLASVWDAESTLSNDVVVYRSASDALVMVVGPPGDDSGAFVEAGRLTSSASAISRVAIAQFDTERLISSENPLLVVVQYTAGAGYYLVDRLIPFHVVGAVDLPGSIGFPGGVPANELGMDVVATPGGSHGRWFVLVSEDDPDFDSLPGDSYVHAWEVFGPDHTARSVPLVSDSVFRTRVTLALEEAGVRAAFEADDRIVTSALVCTP